MTTVSGEKVWSYTTDFPFISSKIDLPDAMAIDQENNNICHFNVPLVCSDNKEQPIQQLCKNHNKCNYFYLVYVSVSPFETLDLPFYPNLLCCYGS